MGFLVGLFGFCLASAGMDSRAIASEFSGLATPTPLPQNAWSRIKTPHSTGITKSIGFYSAGCIDGAHTLPLDGQGYQIMHPERNRNYGNPELVQFIQNLAIEVQAQGSALLLGDLGQPRGGPMPYGHDSHQIGLDTDVWFWTHPEQQIRSLTLEERATLPMISMLNENGLVDSKKFTQEQVMKLHTAADSALVQRIFVNPAIKTYLCSVLPKNDKANDRAWLHKLRPWPGHDSHFHVRLYCPVNDKNCEPQAEVPAGDGCNEVLPSKMTTEEGSGDDIRPLNPAVEKLLKMNENLPATCATLLKRKH